MDYETARTNMIEQQIRPWNVLAMQTLRALGEVRREDFVPDQYKDLSFADVQIPIGEGEVMLEPKVGARMIEAMAVTPDHNTLVIGTGTGYLVALLATMCKQVTGIEIDPTLSSQAKMNLAMAGIENVELVQGDCFDFCREPANQESKFDSVLITGSVPVIDRTFEDMVHGDGLVVGIQGFDPAMQVVVCGPGGSRKSLFETSVPRLRNVVDIPAFTF
jgi:protein-L-isoaspartate(D-aspartate) O-methyltransferase